MDFCTRLTKGIFNILPPCVQAGEADWVKGPVLKSFMRQIAIIKNFEVPRKFLILSNVSKILISSA